VLVLVVLARRRAGDLGWLVLVLVVDDFVNSHDLSLFCWLYRQLLLHLNRELLLPPNQGPEGRSACFCISNLRKSRRTTSSFVSFCVDLAVLLSAQHNSSSTQGSSTAAHKALMPSQAG
jgi:hypothetical protein